MLLSKRHQIDLVAFFTDKIQYQSAKSYFSKYHINLYGIYFKQPLVGFKQSRPTILKNFLLFKPALFTSIYSAKFKDFVDKILRTKEYDAIHIDHLEMTQYLPKTKRNLWIYEEHNIEYQLEWEQFLSTKKVFFLIESILVGYYERKLLKLFDKIICISEQDKKILSKFLSPHKLFILPPFVFKKRLIPKAIISQLLFVANLNWYPNVIALQWFCKNVLSHLPEIELIVIGAIGKRYKSYFRRFSNCHIKGYVPDLDKFFIGKMYIFIMPITIAQGIRLKALDALARGFPIVSTTKAMYGLRVQPGLHYLEANTPQQFIFQIRRLIKNPLLVKRLRQAGYTYVHKYHSEAAGLKLIDKVYPEDIS